MAITGNMAVGRAQHRCILDECIQTVDEPWWKSYLELVARGGIQYEGLEPLSVEEEGKTVAAIDEIPVLVAILRQGETPGWDAVGRLPHGSEFCAMGEAGEESQERGLPVVFAEAAEESGVGSEAAPALADE